MTVPDKKKEKIRNAFYIVNDDTRLRNRICDKLLIITIESYKIYTYKINERIYIYHNK